MPEYPASHGLLRDKVVVVTAAAGTGIGFATAKRCAEEGALVVVSDHHERRLAEAARAIDAPLAVRCDVTIEDDVQNLFATTARELGRVDVAVNNAGLGGTALLTEMTDDEWHRLININLTSVFRGCKHALPHMIRQKAGSIVNLASAQGHVGLDGWTAYAGAKGAVMAMTRQMAVEFGPHNVRVNSISPGTISTPMNVKVVAELGEHIARAWVKMHPIGRIGLPEEVAEAAIYLASDAAGFTTGHDLRVDGGLTCAPRYVPELLQ